MKHSILLTIASALLLLGLSACQEPESLVPSVSRAGINSITAYFDGDDSEENSFPGEIDYDSGMITFVFPYTYPARSTSHLEITDLTHMRIEANLDDNVSIDPPLLYLDLSIDNEFVLTDQAKNKKTFTIKSEIRKSSECSLIEYKVIKDEDGGTITGIVNDGDNTVTILYGDEPIGTKLAEYTMSFGAKISPDPAVDPQNYDTNFQLTVTAQDGVTKRVYTMQKGMAGKKAYGMREGSQKFLWKKKQIDDIGITTLHLTGGMAVTKDYVVLNTRGQDMVVLDRKTGNNVGTIVLPFKGGTANFYCTADSGNNILVTNLTPNEGDVFKIYLIKGVDGTPEEYISFNAPGVSLGRKISIAGSLDGNAIITAPIYIGELGFYRWQVVGGALKSATPEKVLLDAGVFATAWNYNCDVIYTDPTDVTSDYYLASYGQVSGYSGTDNRAHLHIDGKTNKIKDQSAGISSNWVPNAVDYVVFNEQKFFVSNSVNSFTWGSDDIAYLYDADDLSTTIWKCEAGVYGSFACSNEANGNATGDVALKVSEDGYYMYFYYMFTNGYVVCLQFDCIDM